MDIFWISIPRLKKQELFETITHLEGKNKVFTPNPEILLKAKSDKEFQRVLGRATFLTSDGIGLYIAYQILDSKFPILINIFLLPYYFFNLFFRRRYLYEKYGERICGSDLTKELLLFAEKNDISIIVSDLYNPFDEKKVLAQEKFLESIKKRYPHLRVYFFIWNPQKKELILDQIKASDAKFLFSTLWMKSQEENICEIMEYCPDISLWLWVGSSFDSLTWLQKRAPIMWRSLWLEWFYRLLFGPQKIKRLKRLWNAIFVFIYEVYKEKYQIPNNK
jgi:N-acetylglucosaminyldiphosphoundecaprenol N-acetyl-beta-D-mannosaminyltransferase